MFGTTGDAVGLDEASTATGDSVVPAVGGEVGVLVAIGDCVGKAETTVGVFVAIGSDVGAGVVSFVEQNTENTVQTRTAIKLPILG